MSIFNPFYSSMEVLLAFISVIFVTIGATDNGVSSCFEPLTQNVQPINIHFQLWVDSETSGVDFDGNLTNIDKSFVKSNFRLNRTTFVIIHGFWEHHTVDWVEELKNILLSKEESNVVLVDWSSAYSKRFFGGSILNFDALDYQKAILSTELVANQTSRLLREISKACDTPLDQWPKLHFIGHSLGAHIAGQAARKLKDVVQVHRVTGLDPAGPCFDGVDTPLKLNRSDAKFVDVIHTNCDPIRRNNLGIAEPLGTIDFYPNGGNYQPNCKPPFPKLEETYESILESLGADRFLASGMTSWHRIFYGSTADFKDLPSNMIKRGLHLVCDHQESVRYFIQSLQTPEKKFLASPTLDKTSLQGDSESEEQNSSPRTCVEMGINADKYSNARGMYSIDTTSEIPECGTR